MLYFTAYVAAALTFRMTRSIDTLTLSHPAELSKWGRYRISTDAFLAYLRKTIDDPEGGDVYEEFVGVGCCGSALDVPLRIESISNPGIVTDETTIEYTERDDCEIAGGWSVQSRSAP